jgi:tRNA(fMet)-specific endonuclease VapC
VHERHRRGRIALRNFEERLASRLSAQVEAFLQSVDILAFAPPEDFAYARIRVQLERAGTIIGANDLLLARRRWLMI